MDDEPKTTRADDGAPAQPAARATGEETPERGSRRRLVFTAGVVLVCVAILAALWPRGATFAEFLERIQQAGPVPFFALLAVLPCVGFPSTPFFLLAGPAFGVAVSLIGSSVALAAQIALSYWLARHRLHGWLERLLASTPYNLPEVTERNYWKAALLIKLPPGVHPALKHSVMALAGIPFGICFLVSWPLSLAYAAGTIVVGDSAWDRDYGRFVLGVAALVVLVLAVRWLHRRYGR